MPRRARAVESAVAPYCASELLTLDPLPAEQLALAFAEWHPLRFAIRRVRAPERPVTPGTEPYRPCELRLEAYERLLVWTADALPNLDPARATRLAERPDADLRGLLEERRPTSARPEAAIVWDHGTYRPLAPGPLTPGRAVVEALRAGRMNFWIEGARLRGAFRLEIGRGGWRLAKLADAHASTRAVLPDDLSILTGRPLAALPPPRAPRRERAVPLTLDL